MIAKGLFKVNAQVLVLVCNLKKFGIQFQLFFLQVVILVFSIVCV